jgi:hypothetical protein
MVEHSEVTQLAFQQVRFGTDSVEEVGSRSMEPKLAASRPSVRRALAAALGSAWPVSEGSGRLLRGGTRRERRLVLVVAVCPA